ncbi:MAG: hypothetical protein R2771_10215, partial [Saprospiraceae bacterium]
MDFLPVEICRTFRIVQGDLGFINKTIVHSVELGADISDYSLSFMGTALAIDSIVGNTYYYSHNLSNAPYSGNVGNGDNKFENGEIIYLQECFKVNGCSQANNTTTHQLTWGCLDESCQVSSEYTGSVGVTGLTPTTTQTRTINEEALCLDGTSLGHFQWKVTNTSSNDAEYKFFVRFPNTSGGGSWQDNLSTISIGGSTQSFASLTSNYTNSLYGSCGDRITTMTLTDILLPAGDTAVIDAYYVACCLDQCGPMSTPSWWDLVGYAKNACSGNYEYLFRNLYIPSNGNKDVGDPVSSGPIFMTGGQTGTFCMEYPSYDLLLRTQDLMSGTVNFTIGLPTGFMFEPNTLSLVLGSGSNTYSATPTSATMNIGMDTMWITYQVSEFLQSNVGRLFIICFDATLDCNKPGALTGAQQMSFDWNNIPKAGCDCVIPMGCDHKYDVFMNCPIPCPDGGGIIDNVSAYRTNYGLEDPSNTRSYTSGASTADPNAIRIDRMSPGDTFCIHVETGVVIGDSSAQGPPPHWIQGYIDQDVSWGSVFDAL